MRQGQDDRPTDTRPSVRPGVHAERVLVVIGILLLAQAAVHWYDALAGLFLPGYATQPRSLYVARLACLCTVSGAVLGVAFVLRNRVVGTYGLVLWAIYPLQAMVYDLLDPQIRWAIAYKGPSLSLVAPVFALFAGLFDRRHVLLAAGVSMVGFWAKGMINQAFGAPEAQITLVETLGAGRFAQVFPLLNWGALALGVPLALAGWIVLRRLSRGA